ncbi:MAG: M20/M25/M40 family metallo-hydrolase [Bdellovibrionota bacterium]
MIKYNEEIETKALAWFKELLKFDTSNPPGNEKAAIDHIAGIVKSFGIEPKIIYKSSPARPNLYASLEGKKAGPKLLLSSHVDVVPIEDATSWSFDPFSASEFEDCIWSRGTLDMKFKTAFDLALLSLAAEQKDSFAGSLELVCVCDEEVGSEHGSKFLMDQHRDLFKATHVLNELGGFNLNLAGTELILIQAGEKHSMHMRIHCLGQSTHACVPPKETAIKLLSEVMLAFSTEFLGFQLCPITNAFFDTILNTGNPITQTLVPLLKDPNSVEQTLETLPDAIVRTELKSMLCHTVVPTRIGGGFKINVIPEAAWADFDCRIVPTVNPQEFRELVKKFISLRFPNDADNIQIEFMDEELGYEIDMQDEIFQSISKEIEKFWSDKPTSPKSAPMLLPAGSDSRNYANAGIVPIGFAPLYFPPDFPGFTLAHAANERVPISAFLEGLKAYINTVSSLLS